MELWMNKKLNLFVLLLVVSALAFTSCKKDNNELTSGGTAVPGDSSVTIDGHEYVDLGLPSGILWATCNIGADSPEDYGSYFAWGETETKNAYNWRTYKWCGEDYDKVTKYNTDSDCGTVDEKTVLDPEDDAAHKNWGEGWRMPTREEMDELKRCCSWRWTIQNGVKGKKVTGPNGKYIFLPVAGFYNDDGLINVGSYGYYWSSSLSDRDPRNASYLYFYSANVSVSNIFRFFGKSVRPVCNPQ